MSDFFFHFKNKQREIQLERLKGEKFDLLVIGGGATGTGVALDASLRGLKVALIESSDFSSGTSSRSTKLIHGGVRYLEQAFKQLKFQEYALVKEALQERKTLLSIAPHLTRTLAIITPCYSWFSLVYYLIGLKLYDFIAGARHLGSSKWVSAHETLKQLPYVKAEKLKGGVLYYDGQFDDARMNILIAKTAETKGAVVANYISLTGFIKEKGLIKEAQVKDALTADTFTIKATHFINCTGPFLDEVRRIDDSDCEPLLEPSKGTHIILDKQYTKEGIGMLIPKTSDNRVLFMLPWQGSTLVGTTDEKVNSLSDLTPSNHEIDFLLEQLDGYVHLNDRSIRASFSGTRPLMGNKSSKTDKITRDYKIVTSSSGLISIGGGKWTTYRKMAEDVVNCISMKICKTASTPLFGAEEDCETHAKELEKEYGIDSAIAKHLSESYGKQAKVVLACDSHQRKRLVDGYPYILAEIPYVIKHEYALSPDDILYRRLRLGFLDESATIKAKQIIQETYASIVL